MGYLTKHGYALMQLMGAYDREYFTKAGLLDPAGCATADKFYFWSDSMQRDVETGRAIASSMFPQCQVAVHSLPDGRSDPLFSPLAAGVGKSDPALAAAALSGRIGGNPQLLTDTYRAAFEAMRKVLLGPEGKSAKKDLFEEPGTVTPQKDRLAVLNGPLALANRVTDGFLLEYTEGMKEQDVGWGRLNRATLSNLMLLREAYADLTLRTPYLARASGSNLLSHMLRSMQQSVRGETVAGALGKPGDKGLFLLGHDSNLEHLGGILRISWLLEEDQPTSSPPGGALVFEVWREMATGRYSVRTYFMSQSLDQMRNATPLSLDTPPHFSPIFVPGCSTSAPGWPCDWDAFQRVVEGDVDPAFVSAAVPVEAPRP
jgi:4-phytase/acid phosphatase